MNAGGHVNNTPLYANNQFLFTAVNNILSGGLSDIAIAGGGSRTAAGINNNIYRDLFALFGDLNTFGWEGRGYYIFSKWQAACHCDSASKLITGAQTTAFSATTQPFGATVAEAGLATPDAAAASDAVNMAVVTTAATSDLELEYLSTVGQGNGINLSELAVDDLAPLAFDKKGAARPASGPWNIGPY